MCNLQLSRNGQCSICTQCKFVTHTKCAMIAPKTCGLPQGLVKHYAKSVVKTNSDDVTFKIENANCESLEKLEGWIKVLKLVSWFYFLFFFLTENFKLKFFFNF